MSSHHVIVGASAAGVAAALAMRAHGFDGRITLVDAGGEEPYERPPLSKTFADLDVVRPIIDRGAYADNDITLRLSTRVAGLDVDRRRVVLGDGEQLEADKVLLATGVRARRLGIAGENLRHVLVLRDLADARAVGARLAAGGPWVIVGGGFIGLEAAAVARSRGIEVTVVEAMAIPLLGVLGPSLAADVQRMHEERGVRFLTGRTAARFAGAGQVEQVVLDDGTVLPAATVLVGCGVEPEDDLARRAGVHCDGGVVADEHGRTSVPWIWSAGDVASVSGPFTRRRQRIEHWDVAQRQGAVAGADMTGAEALNGHAPYFWSDQYGRRLQMYGRPSPGDRLVIRPGDQGGNQLAMWVQGSRLTAAFAIDRPKDLRATKPLIESGRPVTVAALTDPAISLRSLAR
ncbi:NAD(P)/FAD-dependent oxidoreductase [Actinoplanes sp. CA-131856]